MSTGCEVHETYIMKLTHYDTRLLDHSFVFKLVFKYYQKYTIL